jgi:hypothetical protein
MSFYSTDLRMNYVKNPAQGGRKRIGIGSAWWRTLNSLNELPEASDTPEIREMPVPTPTATLENVIDGGFLAIITPHAPGVSSLTSAGTRVFSKRLILFFLFVF